MLFRQTRTASVLSGQQQQQQQQQQQPAPCKTSFSATLLPLCVILLTDRVLCLLPSQSFSFFFLGGGGRFLDAAVFFLAVCSKKEHTVRFGTPLVSSSQKSQRAQAEVVNGHTF